MLNSILNGDWSNSVPGRQFPKFKLTPTMTLARLLRGVTFGETDGMKLNVSKTKDMIVSKSCSSLNASPVTPINYWWNCAEGVWWLDIWSDIWFHDDLWESSSLSFQSSRAASQKLDMLRKFWLVFHDRLLLGRLGDAFRVFPAHFGVLFCCSAVWCSASDAHLKLLDRVVSGACCLTWLCLCVTLLIINLWQTDSIVYSV